MRVFVAQARLNKWLQRLVIRPKLSRTEVKMKTIFKILILTVSLVAVYCQAGSQGGSFKVSKLRLGGDGVYVGFSPAPAGCNGGDHYRIHAKLGTGADNYNAIYSALLMAYTSGNTLNYIWFTDLPSSAESCSSTGGHWLGLKMIELSGK